MQPHILREGHRIGGASEKAEAYLGTSKLEQLSDPRITGDNSTSNGVNSKLCSVTRLVVAL
jgi:hypothetical protein